MKTQAPVTVVSEKSPTREAERSSSDLHEPSKDWAPLMSDFDRRVEVVERNQKQQEDTNARVDGKLNEHDDAIRKLQQEIKMIKMQRRNNDAAPTDGAVQDDGLSGDQLSELFDAIN